ncbi:M23 family metallopeptidase [Microbacterium sp. NPDC058345]|uniref:M23 family metallopeptidase n=1 Tax=Microbacterium sp. NPDC058345 TaxID=3346455 RepID=UPI0036501826
MTVAVATSAASAPSESPVAEARTTSAVEESATPAADTPRIDAFPADTPRVDAFAVASEAFGFGPVAEVTVAPEARVTRGADADDADADPQRDADVVPDAAIAHVAPRRPRPLRKVLAAGASFGVMGIAGLIAVSMTLPANAVAAVQGGSAPLASLVAAKDSVSSPSVEKDDIQAFVASSGVQDEELARSDSFSAISLADVAAEEGINYSSEVFTNDPGAAIQWPFMVGVGMSYGYGMRSGRLHEGIDFVPGSGAPVQAIADGTVRIATEQGGAYGVTVYIDHVIDGEVITSHYAHMQYGSLRVQPGEKVTVGTVVGKTGNTGRSYGAHMHFELIVNGSTIDPLPWLRENAGRSDGVTAP